MSEGKRERIQYFEGVCIAKKIEILIHHLQFEKFHLVKVLKELLLYIVPIIGSIKVIRSGKVRRAKLYYLRDRKGKSARIAEKIKKKIGVDISEKSF